MPPSVDTLTRDRVQELAIEVTRVATLLETQAGLLPATQELDRRLSRIEGILKVVLIVGTLATGAAITALVKTFIGGTGG